MGNQQSKAVLSAGPQDIIHVNLSKKQFEDQARITGFTNNSVNSLEYSPSPQKIGNSIERSRNRNKSRTESNEPIEVNVATGNLGEIKVPMINESSEPNIL